MRREMIVQDNLLVDRAEASMEDLQQVADHCKRLQNEGLTGTKELRVLAHVPPIIVEKYCNDNGVSFSEFMRNPEHAQRMLNDPALAHFRVHPGRV